MCQENGKARVGIYEKEPNRIMMTPYVHLLFALEERFPQIGFGGFLQGLVGRHLFLDSSLVAVQVSKVRQRQEGDTKHIQPANRMNEVKLMCR